MTSVTLDNADSLLTVFRSALTEEVAEILNAPCRDSAIFLRLLGLDGAETAPLRKVAILHGLSAERVRKISEKIERQTIPLFATGAKYVRLRDMLEEAVTTIKEAVPGCSTLVGDHLRNARLTNGLFLLNKDENPASIIRLSALLGCQSPVQLVDWGGCEAIMHASEPNQFRKIMAHARKLASASGAVSDIRLAESLENFKELYICIEECNAMLASHAQLLTTHSDGAQVEHWYVFSELVDDTITRNKNRIGSLGWCSLSQMTNFEPTGAKTPKNKSNSFTNSLYLMHLPAAVLEKLLIFRGFSVKGDRVTLSTIEPQNRLSKIQEAMVLIMRKMSRPGPVKQADFIQQCSEQGIKISTVRVYLHRSGLFRCGAGMCSLTP